MAFAAVAYRALVGETCEQGYALARTLKLYGEFRGELDLLHWDLGLDTLNRLDPG